MKIKNPKRNVNDEVGWQICITLSLTIVNEWFP